MTTGNTEIWPVTIRDKSLNPILESKEIVDHIENNGTSSKGPVNKCIRNHNP